MAASALLNQHGVLLGGGAGAAPYSLAAALTGTVMIGVTGTDPGFSTTPVLGTDNSVAGTLQFASTAGTAHTIIGSAATTTNTVNFFATVPTTGHLIDCTVTTTTCLLHDSGVVTANVVTSASSLTSGALMAGAGSQGSQTIPDFSWATHTITQGASGIFDASTAGAQVKVVTQAANNNSTQAASTAYVDSSEANMVTAASAATAANQTCVASGASKTCTYIDFPERFMVPAANCNNTTAGAGWSIGASGTVTCRAGTNNLGGFISITDTSSSFAQFQVSLPADWVSTNRPYVLVAFESATDTTNGHTVIPEVAISCTTATNGTASDDITLSAYQSLATVTFGGSAVAHGFYTTSAQLGLPR